MCFCDKYEVRIFWSLWVKSLLEVHLSSRSYGYSNYKETGPPHFFMSCQAILPFEMCLKLITLVVSIHRLMSILVMLPPEALETVIAGNYLRISIHLLLRNCWLAATIGSYCASYRYPPKIITLYSDERRRCKTGGLIKTLNEMNASRESSAAYQRGGALITMFMSHTVLTKKLPLA